MNFHIDRENDVVISKSSTVSQNPVLKDAMIRHLQECDFSFQDCGEKCFLVMHIPNVRAIQNDQDMTELVKQVGIDGSMLVRDTFAHGHRVFEIYSVCVGLKKRGMRISKTLFYTLFRFERELQRMYWLGIDMENPMFDKVLKIYAGLGFEIEKIDNQSSDGVLTFPFRALIMTKSGDMSFSPEGTIYKGNIFYNLYQQNRRPLQDDTIALPPDLLSRLKLMVGMGSVEIGGGFFVERQYRGVNVINVMKDNFNYGSYQEVPITNPKDGKKNRYVFHTHHAGLYNHYNTYFGSPSNTDIQNFLMWPETVLSFVITVEGIYILQRNPDFYYAPSCMDALHYAVGKYAVKTHLDRVRDMGSFDKEKVSERISKFKEIVNNMTVEKIQEETDTDLTNCAIEGMGTIPIFQVLFNGWSEMPTDEKGYVFIPHQHRAGTLPAYNYMKEQEDKSKTTTPKEYKMEVE